MEENANFYKLTACRIKSALLFFSDVDAKKHRRRRQWKRKGAGHPLREHIYPDWADFDPHLAPTSEDGKHSLADDLHMSKRSGN